MFQFTFTDKANLIKFHISAHFGLIYHTAEGVSSECEQENYMETYVELHTYLVFEHIDVCHRLNAGKVLTESLFLLLIEQR